jgi:hypothetical protein
VEWRGIRDAGNPSFSTKRAVLPEMLEKYTRSGALVANRTAHPGS